MNYEITLLDGACESINDVSYMRFIKIEGTDDWLAAFYDDNDEIIECYPVSLVDTIKC